MNYDLREMLEANKARADEVRAQLAERRDHSAEYWERPETPAQRSSFNAPEPHQPPPPTMAEIERKIAKAQSEIEQKTSNTLADYERDREAALAEHDKVRRDAVGDALAEIRKQLRAEFQEQLGLLRADLKFAKANSGGHHGDVVDLPNPLMRSRRA